MTDDELLARLKQRARELRATHAHAEENRDGWFATMPPEIGEAWLREAALLDRVIEIIERHRAEVERLTRERDAWELTSRTSSATAKVYEDVARGKSLDQSIVLDAVNRLNEVRNYAPPCVTRHEMEQALELIRDAMIANMSRAEAAESALAAKRKRVGELEQRIREWDEWRVRAVKHEPGAVFGYENAGAALRAALAGKESESTEHQK